MEETTVQETTAQVNTNTEETTLKIEPRGAVSEETEVKQIGIEGEILPDETVTTSEGESEQASTEAESGEVTSGTENSDTSTETTTLTETTAEPTSMSIPFIGLSIIQCVVAFLLIVVVLQQSKSASSGMTSSGMIGSGDNQSYWSQNKGRSKESKLARMTVILGVIFFIITIALGFVK